MNPLSHNSKGFIGRLSKETIVNSGAYTRYEYPTNGIQSKVYSTLIDTNNNGVGDSADEVLSESWTDGAGRVLKTRTPISWNGQGNPATWAGQLIEYDLLGRVKRQSIPAEVDANWNLAGDDAVRGYWLWTYQKYDWQNRVVRRINTDGVDSPTLNDSDVLISYEGCGCAGGLVTTIEAERVPVPGTSNFARRKQKIYEDILGRVWKTESFNWDGVSVYSTIVQKFNGRDQVYKTTEYAGAENPNNPHQETTASYDGHGRLKQTHRPQQRDANNNWTYTTYNYNPDDSISSVVDARGATKTYSYNSRGLLSEISYSAPQPITVPGGVDFTYDNAGNRLTMTDDLGTVSHQYDSLSRMTAETRQFNTQDTGLPNNTATLNYSYTLSGKLKSYTLPFFSNLEVKYDFDQIGRLSGVSGASSLGNFNYANNAQYRAWGALKHLEYGNGVEVNATNFNNRLQATGFEVKKNTTQILAKTYEFYSDGLVKKETDALNAKFDRSYEYDYLARMTKALSGAEARGQTDNPSNIPYRAVYQYDAFGHRTQTTVNHWTQGPTTQTLSYVNNRRTSGTHDGEGNLLHDGGYKSFKTDAANRLVHTDYEYADSQTYNREQELIKYDGDGQIIRVETTVQDAVNGQPVGGDLVYKIRSTMLGGETVYEKGTAFIYAGGDRIAMVEKVEYPSAALVTKWHHKDANQKSYRSTDANGTVLGDGSLDVDWDKIETDADGKSVGLSAPISYPTDSNDLYTSGWSFGSLSSGQFMTYSVDGLHVPPEFFADRIGARIPGFELNLLEFSVMMSYRIREW